MTFFFKCRLNFSTAFSSNAVSICHSVGLNQIVRLELSVRYQFISKKSLTESERTQILSNIHDRMTQCQYVKPLKSFDLGVRPEVWFQVDILKEGRKALEDVNQKLGKALYFG